MSDKSQQTYFIDCDSKDPVVLFQAWIEKYPDISIVSAAFQVLTNVVSNSTSTTLMGIQNDINVAIDAIVKTNPTSISLRAGCSIFLRSVTRMSNGTSENDYKPCLIERGHNLAQLSLKARSMITNLSEDFIRDEQTILVHGYSRVVNAALINAYSQGKNIKVYVSECRPECLGYKTASELTKEGIPVIMLCDTAIARRFSFIDTVLVGAEGVVESGGIVNTIGTLQLAIISKALNKPFYVLAESFKFVRLYPLSQNDLNEGQTLSTTSNPSLPEGVTIDYPSLDYTPPEYINLLFTDLGILTPSAISDELIKFHN